MDLQVGFCLGISTLLIILSIQTGFADYDPPHCGVQPKQCKGDADGSPDDGVQLIGPSPFVTDGSRNLTLTCRANASYPQPAYGWVGKDCSSNTETCTWTPTIEDDGMNVLCTATAKPMVHGSPVQGTGHYRLQLAYPPESPPEIVTDTNTDVLSSGNNLTCSVHGGKPLVTSVNFHCTDPYLPDQDDVTNATSVTSTIVINATHSTSSLTRCTCYAEWATEPGLYQKRSEKTFTLEYKATVANFTVNDTVNLTVQEDGSPPLVFSCDASSSRPPATLSLRKLGNGTFQVSPGHGKFDVSSGNGTFDVSASNTGTESQHNESSASLAYTVFPARCEDTGVFVCAADNGFSEPSALYVRVNVTCGPRSYNTSHTVNDPPELTPEGLSAFLVANPVPHAFSYNHANDDTAKTTTPVPDGAFHTQCVGHESTEFLVRCNVKGLDISEMQTGLYNVSIINVYGKYTFSFQVKHAVTSPDETASKTSSTMGPMIAGGIAAVIVVVVVVVILIWFRRKNKSRKTIDGRLQNTHHNKTYNMTVKGETRSYRPSCPLSNGSGHVSTNTVVTDPSLSNVYSGLPGHSESEAGYSTISPPGEPPLVFCNQGFLVFPEDEAGYMTPVPPSGPRRLSGHYATALPATEENEYSTIKTVD